MFPQQFLSLEFYQKKKNILLYRAKDQAHAYILKSIITKDDADLQAFYDEYESLSHLDSPFLPVYHGICENFTYPDRDGSYLTLCMEDCSPRRPLDEISCNAKELLSILYQTGSALLYLLENGILYTDLHPANILIHKDLDHIEITLLDFTYCYYYRLNPHPAYKLRFSYELCPALKGHQLLIQELALLLQEMMQRMDAIDIPSKLYLLLETGLHPTEWMNLPDYLLLIEHTII